jgi:hypothetical protein
MATPFSLRLVPTGAARLEVTAPDDCRPYYLFSYVPPTAPSIRGITRNPVPSQHIDPIVREIEALFSTLGTRVGIVSGQRSVPSLPATFDLEARRNGGPCDRRMVSGFLEAFPRPAVTTERAPEV